LPRPGNMAFAKRSLINEKLQVKDQLKTYKEVILPS